ncbi:MAG: hypothetical protein QXI58_02530 [Candidatus Micrarchaeia archaeon]
MVTFSRQYIEPGVYVESEIKPPAVIGAVGNFVPVLIGTADDYKKVESDEIPQNGTAVKYKGNSVLITNINLTAPYRAITYIKDSLGYTFYCNVTGTDKDFDIVADDNNNAQISWNQGKAPNGPYKVYFFLKKSSGDYDAKFFYSTQINEALDFLGRIPFDETTGTLRHSLPVGLKLAFANGCSSVWCISLKKSDGSQKTVLEITDEISSLKNPDNTAPYTIVYLGGFIVNGTNNDLTQDDVTALVQYVRKMSSVEEQRECIALFGPPVDADLSNNSVENYKLTAALLKDRRVVYCYPSNVIITENGVEYTVGGYFIAAALAGLIDSVAINMPLTGQLIAGLTPIDRKLRSDKNVMAQNGILIVEDSKIRHALTTNQDNSLTGELKITRITDYVIRIMRSSLSSFVNQPYSSGLLSTIAMSVKLILTQLANTNAIIDYRDIAVTRNETEPRQIDVSFAMRPTFDMNWIYVKFTVET